MPYYFGKDKGFFAAEQIEPQLVMMAPPTAIAALVGASWIFLRPPAPRLRRSCADCRFGVYFTFSKIRSTCLLAQPEIKSVEELIGKTIGVTALTDAVGCRPT